MYNELQISWIIFIGIPILLKIYVLQFITFPFFREKGEIRNSLAPFKTGGFHIINQDKL